MNYQSLHDRIVDRARGRVLQEGVYYEWHHVHPKCEGGAEDGERVPLLLKEHALIHILRYKITSNKGHLGAYNLLKRHRDNVWQRKDNASYAAKESHRQRLEDDPQAYSECQRQKAIKAGAIARDQGLGIFALSEEEKQAARAKGTQTIVDNKIGMFSDEYRKAHAKSMSKKVLVEDIVYNSCQEAAKALGVSPGTISYRIKSGKITILETGTIRSKMQCQE